MLLQEVTCRLNGFGNNLQCGCVIMKNKKIEELRKIFHQYDERNLHKCI